MRNSTQQQRSARKPQGTSVWHSCVWLDTLPGFHTHNGGDTLLTVHSVIWPDDSPKLGSKLDPKQNTIIGQRFVCVCVCGWEY